MGQRLCFSSALQGEMDSIDLDKDFPSSGSYPNDIDINLFHRHKTLASPSYLALVQ